MHITQLVDASFGYNNCFSIIRHILVQRSGALTRFLRNKRMLGTLCGHGKKRGWGQLLILLSFRVVILAWYVTQKLAKSDANLVHQRHLVHILWFALALHLTQNTHVIIYISFCITNAQNQMIKLQKILMSQNEHQTSTIQAANLLSKIWTPIAIVIIQT